MRERKNKNDCSCELPTEGKVLETRVTPEGYKRRRYRCRHCGGRFTTMEITQRALIDVLSMYETINKVKAMFDGEWLRMPASLTIGTVVRRSKEDEER